LFQYIGELLFYSYESTYNILTIPTNDIQTVKKMRPTYIGFGVKLIRSTLTIAMGEFGLFLLLVMT
jgi:hypothetical protein